MMDQGGLLGLLVVSAVRSLLLGGCVLAAVKLTRLRDLVAEIGIWSAVLLAALAMPILTLWLPGLAVALPFAAREPAVAGPAIASAPSWLATHAGIIALAIYSAPAGFGLIRLLAGLALMARLHARATPIAEPWTLGRDIRESAQVAAPLTYARAILLPQGWREWPAAKLQAVLAHEDSHLRRGDFFILVLASAHRALFWFSPFAWWLKARLGDLAEAASDRAAARRIADPAGYAEILLDVARTRRAPGPAMAMSGGPDLARRIDQLLDGRPERTLGRAGLLLALCGVLTLGLGLAGVRAAAPAATAGVSSSIHLSKASQPARATGREPRSRAASDPPKVAARASRRRTLPAATAIATAPPAPTPAAEEVSYDPRALLEEPEAAVLPAVLLAGHRVNPAED